MAAWRAALFYPRGAKPHNPVNCVNLYSINERLRSAQYRSSANEKFYGSQFRRAPEY